MGRVLKGEWEALIGRTIDQVVVSAQQRTPRSQVHLIFSDGSTFEIYSSNDEGIGGSSRIYRGNIAEVLSYTPPGVEISVYSNATADTP